MYRKVQSVVEAVLRIPPEPEAPPGDEDAAKVFRASPKYYKLKLILWGIGRAFGAAAILFGSAIALGVLAEQSSSHLVFALMAIVFVSVLFVLNSFVSYVVLRLDYEKRWYLITDRSLRVRHGVLSVSEMTITFANIQNISVSQGPLQRALGISDLKVDTAGGAGSSTAGNRHAPAVNLHTAWFKGVDNAEEIRELMQQRLRALKDAGLGDSDDRPAPGAGSAVSPRGSAALTVALREVLAEAAALRGTVAGIAGTPTAADGPKPPGAPSRSGKIPPETQL